MNIIAIIEKKKHGKELTDAEIQFVIEGVTNGTIEDYQISALLMAIYFKGMTDDETIALTKYMVESGDVVNLDSIQRATVDKHSTGGVGDKTSLVLTSILACFDLAVAKMSGRGLGHTGGTIDKLESLEGFNVEITEEEFTKQVNEVGQAIIGQTANLVPADKKLYALRDVTATVDSIPLIAASIMSKKIASGAQTIVLDVKYGSGAFMQTVEDAEALAEKLVMIGKGMGRNTTAIISNMDQPLGLAIGNVLEVEEAITALTGNGPKDLMEVTYALATELLLSTKTFKTEEEAVAKIDEVLTNGQALDMFKAFIKAQGATDTAIEDMPSTQEKLEVRADEAGYVEGIVADEVGRAASLLGAGRMKKTDVIDLAVGIVLNKKIGDRVEEGDLVFEIYFNDDTNLEAAVDMVSEAYHLSENKCEAKPSIAKIIR